MWQRSPKGFAGHDLWSQIYAIISINLTLTLSHSHLLCAKARSLSNHLTNVWVFVKQV